MMMMMIISNLSRDTAVGKATGYDLDGVRVPMAVRIFCSPRRPDQFWGHPASYPMGSKFKY
jgi:hypothetical protein